MNEKLNPVVCFEIPVVDMERSKAFYEGFCAYFEDSEGNRIGLHTM